MVSTNESYDRAAELKAFDETKAGVKGLVDAGISKVPRIFIHTPDPSLSHSPPRTDLSIPVIDLSEIDKGSNSHKSVVERIRDASETWGFFQVENHGIPVTVLEEMLEGVRRFFEQDEKVKKGYYTRDRNSKVVYNSNYDLYRTTAAKWRDSLYCVMAPNPPSQEDLPSTCSEILIEYKAQVMRLGSLLMELLSEALGLKPSHLNDIGCNEGLAILCHYYPACPQPELTIGSPKHTDDFITVLLTDQIGGLQVLMENQWVDVPPVPGALVINVGGLLQLISNDKFKSIDHRVLANKVGPRVSVASVFSTALQPSSKVYGPIKELLSDDNPPKYRETTVEEFITCSMNKGSNGVPNLLKFRL